MIIADDHAVVSSHQREVVFDGGVVSCKEVRPGFQIRNDLLHPQ